MRLLIFLLTFSIVSFGQSPIITEIFADPTPSKGLPEREFLEIYNPSEQAVSLKGFTLEYGNSTVELPDSTLSAGGYAILCRNAYTEEFRNYGKVIGLSRLSLNNNGTILKLINPLGLEIQYIPYAFDWYKPGLSEGVSLEMIDTGYPCVGSSNWGSSQAPLGATPGKENSISKENPDNTPPTLLEYTLSANQIILVFDEILSAAFLEEINNFEIIEGERELDSATFREGQRSTVLVTLKPSEEENFKLRIYNLEDCSGNVSDDLDVTFLNLPEPQIGEIQISEILFNPKVGGSDFVELYNPTPLAFNLKNWMIARKNSQGQMDSWVELSDFDLVLEPDTYLAFTSDKDFLVNNYPYTGNIEELPKLPAYNNDFGTVYLLRPDSSVFDEFSYSENMHAMLINNPDGVSLEKVSFRKNQNTWTSASSDAGYATPGLVNSQNENDFLEQVFYAEPLVFNPHQSSEITYLTYKLSSGGNYAVIFLVDKTGRKVRNLGSNLLLGTQGRIPWDGRDDSGNILPVGYYVFVIKVFNRDMEQTYLAKTVLGSY